MESHINSSMGSNNRAKLRMEMIVWGVLGLMGLIGLFALISSVFFENGSFHGGGHITAFDLRMQELFFSVRNPGLTTIAIIITEFGYWYILSIICILLLINKKFRFSIGLPVSIAALIENPINSGLKRIFERPRPDELMMLVHEDSFSFPSGHSVASMVSYGLLCYLIIKHVPPGALKKVATGLCIFLMIAVGLTRIYLGVHYPTDVLAGWCEGIVIIAVTVIITVAMTYCRCYNQNCMLLKLIGRSQ